MKELSGQDITVCIFADGFSFAVILSAVSFTTQSSTKLTWWFTQAFPQTGYIETNKTRKYLVQPHDMQIFTQERQKYIYQQILLVGLQNGLLNSVTKKF